jgi:hypothetical protein
MRSATCICIASIRSPERTNSTSGLSKSRSGIEKLIVKYRENIMGLQNEKIEALSFVSAELNYLAPLRDRPRTYTFEPPPGEPRTNTVPEPHALPIYDVRPIAESVSRVLIAMVGCQMRC